MTKGKTYILLLICTVFLTVFNGFLWHNLPSDWHGLSVRLMVTFWIPFFFGQFYVRCMEN